MNIDVIKMKAKIEFDWLIKFVLRSASKKLEKVKVSKNHFILFLDFSMESDDRSKAIVPSDVIYVFSLRGHT